MSRAREAFAGVCLFATCLCGAYGLSWWAALCGAAGLVLVSLTRSQTQLASTGAYAGVSMQSVAIASLLNGAVASGTIFVIGRVIGWAWATG
jgi:hypothetical protein